MSIIYRPLRDTDYDALAFLLNEADLADGQAQNQTGEEIREDFESHPLDLADHTLAAWRGDQLVGVVYAYYLPSRVREVRCYVLGAVKPECRGEGIGRVLLGWGIQKAEAILHSAKDDLPKYLRVDVSRANDSAIRLLERVGLQPVRYFADLHRPLAGPAPAIPPPPAATEATAGFRVVPWDLTRNDEARHVKDTAFQDHWGSTPTLPEWWVTATTGFGARQDLSFFAVNDHDDIIGILLSRRYENDDSLLGAKYAWINHIGTLAEWRGRGVATQLLVSALNSYRHDGLDYAALGVDSDNPTGAYRLYESLGFVPWRQTVTYQRVVSA